MIHAKWKCDRYCALLYAPSAGACSVGGNYDDKRLYLNGYHNIITRCRDDGPKGGVALFIKENINFKLRQDISVFIPHVFKYLFIELVSETEKNTIVGVVYRPNSEPKADMDIFLVLYLILWTQ